jgi:hypothetical protein
MRGRPRAAPLAPTDCERLVTAQLDHLAAVPFSDRASALFGEWGRRSSSCARDDARTL